MIRTLAAFVVATALTACGSTMMTQEAWVDEMKRTYPPGTPEAQVEASVTGAGMSYDEAPETFRRLPREVTGDGSGYWRRVTKREKIPGCNQVRTAYIRYTDAGQLITVYPGDGFCA